MTQHWTDNIPRHACIEAVEWAKTQPDAATAWAACPDGGWMLWLVGRLSGPPESDSRQRVVRAACACARLALPIYEARCPGDNRPRRAIDVAEAHARGEAALAEVRQAFSNIPNVSNVDVAATNAADAAYAAANAAFADTAYVANTAASAASAAAHAAFAQRVEEADVDVDECPRALLECADIVRKHYPEPPVLPETKS